MTSALWLFAVLPLGLVIYAYVLYPLATGLLAAYFGRYASSWEDDPATWPTVTLLIPAHNEVETIADKLDNALALDYPSDRLQILVASDASTDGTDEIVRSYARLGVELSRLEERGGKEEAQNHALRNARGEVIVNTDATTRLRPESLRNLIRPFSDPQIGVASGRAIGVERGGGGGEVAEGETLYFLYEMAVREAETRLASIVGASGSFYAARAELVSHHYPSGLSRDFGTPLIARQHGYRSVLVKNAVCYVPAGGSLRKEFGRKGRTMSRGLHTLWHFRELLNPASHGWFSYFLASHKLGRWSVYFTIPVALIALLFLAPQSAVAAGALAALIVAGGLGLLTAWWPFRSRVVPAPLALLGYVTLSTAAGAAAWSRVLRRRRTAVWEPTRRTRPTLDGG